MNSEQTVNNVYTILLTIYERKINSVVLKFGIKFQYYIN